MWKLLSISLCASIISTTAMAECDLGELIGYTLIASKTVVATIKEGGQRVDQFDGYNFGWIVVFEDNTGVACTGYNYHYAYRPKAYIFGYGTSLMMCLDSNLYQVARLQ